MGDATWKNISTDALLAEFFAQDDLKGLAADAGALLECPLLVLDDTFHVTAHYKPLGFSDAVFQDAVRHGEVTYEFGAIISQSKALSAGAATMSCWTTALTFGALPRSSAPGFGSAILFA